MPGDAIEAAARAIHELAVGWRRAQRGFVTDQQREIFLREARVAIRAYLAAQPAERTAAEMREEIWNG